MNYPALGASVNLAARLEGLNKEYGTTVLVSEAVEARVADEFLFRSIDCISPKGFAAKKIGNFRRQPESLLASPHGRLFAALQIGQGAPTLPQLQARSPSHGRSGSFSQTQRQLSHRAHNFIRSSG